MELELPQTKVRQLIRDAQRELFGWVPAEEYYGMFPHENQERTRARIRRGTWVEGVHWARPEARGTWLHLRNIKAWVEGRPPEDDPYPV